MPTQWWFFLITRGITPGVWRALPRLEPALNLALFSVFAFIPVATLLRVPKNPRTGFMVPAWLGYGFFTVLVALAVSVFTIYWFNRPKVLVPPSLRDNPGALRERRQSPPGSAL